MRDCGHCRKWLYDDDKGQLWKDKSGNAILRGAHAPTLCDRHRRGASKACPRGHWSAPTGFDDATWTIYAQIKQCEQTGRWPESPLLAAFAKTVKLAEDMVSRKMAEATRRLSVDLAVMQTQRQQRG